MQPLIFSRSPAGFDAQIAFTLRAYRGQDWGGLRRAVPAESGGPAREAEAAEGDDAEAEA